MFRRYIRVDGEHELEWAMWGVLSLGSSWLQVIGRLSAMMMVLVVRALLLVSWIFDVELLECWAILLILADSWMLMLVLVVVWVTVVGMVCTLFLGN